MAKQEPSNKSSTSECGVDFKKIDRVLVVKPSSFGDVIHTLPAVNALKATFPHLKITWVVNPEWTSILEGNPDLAGVVEFPRRHLGGPMAPVRFARWAQMLQKPQPPEVALDFQGLFRSALISRVSHARHIFGLRDCREFSGWFYDYKADTRECTHAVDRYLQLVASCGAIVRRRSLNFPIPDGTPIGHPDGGELPDRAIVIHPFSRGEGKSMEASQVQSLIDELDPHPVILVGSTDDAVACNISNRRLINLLNRTTISQLIYVIRHAGKVISVDSGPMHLAAAIDKPLLGIHTWTDPRRVGPYRPDAHVWKAGKIMRMDGLKAELCGQNVPLGGQGISEIAEWANSPA